MIQSNETTLKRSSTHLSVLWDAKKNKVTKIVSVSRNIIGIIGSLLVFIEKSGKLIDFENALAHPLSLFIY